MQDVEVERRFIVPSLDGIWPDYHSLDESDGTEIVQGYLLQQPVRSLRIRLSNDQAILTIKGRREGSVRIEYEAGVRFGFGQELLRLCEPDIVQKTRYPIVMGNHIWVIDVFQGRNYGLILAEVELESPTDTISIPDWCGPEITNDPRYYNEYLAKRPYTEWRE